MSERMIRHDAGGLCTLTLNRPEKLNALDTASFEEFDAHLAAIERDEAIGCVVLRGAGRGFCAGADLTAFDEKIPPAFKPGVIERFSRLRQPTIAAVHGVCFTGGIELALAADFIVADASARFCETHGKWGLVGAWGMSQRLPRRIGVPRAKLMMMTAREADSAEAEAMGLVDLLVPAGELDALLASFTGEILANSWHTNFAAKKLILDTDGMSLAEGLAHEHYKYPGFAPDYLERVARFTRR